MSPITSRLVSPGRLAALAFGLALMCAAGCEECETDGDCLILCDCDGDGNVEALYPHDCNGGYCGNSYAADLEDGCEVLCEDQIEI